MGLSQALTTAISGLGAHQTALDVIGNNIANVSTTAYKKGVYSFSTLMEQTLQAGTAADETGSGETNTMSLGLGTQITSITKNYTQGSLINTGNVKDMAIQGNGYYVLRSGNSYVYTRDGAFYLGSTGKLLSSSGLTVQGVMADDDGAISDSGEISDITIAIGTTGGAQETTELSLTGNIYSEDKIATGIKLVSGTTTYAADVASALGSIDTDGSWNVLAAGTDEVVNGGYVLTSAALATYNSGTGLYEAVTDATTTDLGDVYYLSGDTWVKLFTGITDGDQITVKFSKGGSDYDATFTYDSTSTSTLQDFLEFMSGDVDSTADVSTLANLEGGANTDVTGGVMGMIDVAAGVSTANGGTSAYDSPVETAGAFTRTYTSSVDYGSGVLEDSYNISLVSNLGTENSVTSVSFTFNSITYSDVFGADVDYSSVTTSDDSSLTTTLVVYDSLGDEKTVTLSLSLVQQDTNFSTYRWVATSEDDTDADLQVDSAGNITTSVVVGTGIIQFDSNGNFVSTTASSETNGISITLDDQGVSTPIDIELNGGVQDLDFSSLTRVASESDVTLADQDGTAPGTLDSFTVSEDGTIQGVYSNGVVKNIARMVLALFANENGLVAAGDNIFYEGTSSGSAQIGFAGVGGRGDVESGYLEDSNVDLSEEFTNMITIERGYQANARVITTADEMLQELVNLKR